MHTTNDDSHQSTRWQRVLLHVVVVGVLLTTAWVLSTSEAAASGWESLATYLLRFGRRWGNTTDSETRPWLVGFGLVFAFFVVRSLVFGRLLVAVRAELDGLGVEHGWTGRLRPWFFVPVANLFQPYRAIRALLRGANSAASLDPSGAARPVPTVLVAWSTVHIASQSAWLWVAARVVIHGRLDDALFVAQTLAAVDILAAACLARVARMLVYVLDRVRSPHAPGTPEPGAMVASRLDWLPTIVGYALVPTLCVLIVASSRGFQWRDEGRFVRDFAMRIAPLYTFGLVAAHATIRAIRVRTSSLATPVWLASAPWMMAHLYTLTAGTTAALRSPDVPRGAVNFSAEISEWASVVDARGCASFVSGSLLFGVSIALLVAAVRLRRRGDAERSEGLALTGAALLLGAGVALATARDALVTRPFLFSLGLSEYQGPEDLWVVDMFQAQGALITARNLYFDFAGLLAVGAAVFGLESVRRRTTPQATRQPLAIGALAMVFVVAFDAGSTAWAAREVTRPMSSHYASEVIGILPPPRIRDPH